VDEAKAELNRFLKGWENLYGPRPPSPQGRFQASLQRVVDDPLVSPEVKAHIAQQLKALTDQLLPPDSSGQT
jgi:hypothetical protein